MKLLWVLGVTLTLIFLVNPTNAREKKRKAERRKKIGSEIAKESFEAEVKKNREQTLVTPVGSHSNKEPRLISLTTSGPKHLHKHRLHGKHKKLTDYRRKAHKRGNHKQRNHSHNRNHKRSGKKTHKRGKHVKHVQKKNHVRWAFGKGHNKRKEWKRVHSKRNGHKQRHHKRKATKCKDEFDCPSKSCCVPLQQHGTGKVCKRMGHKGCSAGFYSEHVQKKKLSLENKSKSGRVVENFQLKEEKNKFLERSLRVIGMIKRKLKEMSQRRKINGRTT